MVVFKAPVPIFRVAVKKYCAPEYNIKAAFMKNNAAVYGFCQYEFTDSFCDYVWIMSFHFLHWKEIGCVKLY